ncbi:MAG TPA: restriction endonuclease subunit S [Kiritimatiellia bacterium]|nr:restriction endonuclease subunit S [Kiritimatiellia bacterium]
MAHEALYKDLFSSIPVSWQVVPFEEAVDFREGPGILAKDFRTEGVPLIRLRNIETPFVDLTGCNFLDPNMVAARWDHFRVEEGDLLVSTSGTLGRVSIVTADSAGAIPYTGIIRMRPAREDVSPGFIRYFLTSSMFQDQALASAAGSVLKHFGPSHLREMSFPVPPPREQEQIAETLGSLDGKIDQNRRANVALDEMALAIFKAWFVDFEPVKAKAQGEAGFPAMPEAVFDGIADRLVESEIGLIPQGWEVVPLYDVAQFVNGAAFKGRDFCDSASGLPVIKIAELKNGITEQTKYSARVLDDKRCIDSGDMLYSWSGSPETSLAVFIWMRGRGLLNQHIFKVITQSEEQRHFVYYTLKLLRDRLVYIASNKQTTGLGHVTVADMKRLLICRPPEELLQQCEVAMAPLFNRCLTNERESIALADVRDTLLPRLMSGAIPVREEGDELHGG